MKIVTEKWMLPNRSLKYIMLMNFGVGVSMISKNWSIRVYQNGVWNPSGLVLYYEVVKKYKKLADKSDRGGNEKESAAVDGEEGNAQGGNEIKSLPVAGIHVDKPQVIACARNEDPAGMWDPSLNDQEKFYIDLTHDDATDYRGEPVLGKASTLTRQPT